MLDARSDTYARASVSTEMQEHQWGHTSETVSVTALTGRMSRYCMLRLDLLTIFWHSKHCISRSCTRVWIPKRNTGAEISLWDSEFFISNNKFEHLMNKFSHFRIIKKLWLWTRPKLINTPRVIHSTQIKILYILYYLSQISAYSRVYRTNKRPPALIGTFMIYIFKSCIMIKHF